LRSVSGLFLLIVALSVQQLLQHHNDLHLHGTQFCADRKTSFRTPCFLSLPKKERPSAVKNNKRRIHKHAVIVAPAPASVAVTLFSHYFNDFSPFVHGSVCDFVGNSLKVIFGPQNVNPSYDFQLISRHFVRFVPFLLVKFRSLHLRLFARARFGLLALKVCRCIEVFFIIFKEEPKLFIAMK
jgi:hypothetical protein